MGKVITIDELIANRHDGSNNPECCLDMKDAWKRFVKCAIRDSMQLVISYCPFCGKEL